MSKIDDVFPYKVDGKPQFRKNQREAIEFIVDSEEKFVGIDGPVGSGKSVINYTALMATPGKHVYLTPFKQLQDQIGDEKWGDVTVLKGKSGYACPLVQGYESIKYKCDYEGDDEGIEMCTNATPEVMREMDWDEVRESVRETLVNLSGSRALKFKTSFTSMDHYDESIKKAKRYFKGKHKDDSKLYSMIACPHAHIECPKKSARVLSEITKISILNPDIMYLINKYSKRPGSGFDDLGILIVDEAHALEDVIQRIFSTSIPIGMLRDVYGIDMYPIVNDFEAHEAADALKDNYLEYLKRVQATISVLKSVRYVFGLGNEESSTKITTSKAEYVSQFKIHFEDRIRSGDINVLQVIIDSIFEPPTIEVNPLDSIVKQAYAEAGSKFFERIKVYVDNGRDAGVNEEGETVYSPVESTYDDLSSIISAMNNVNVNTAKYNLSKQKDMKVANITDSVIFFNMLDELGDVMDQFVMKTDTLSSLSSKDFDAPFLIDTSESLSKDAIPYNIRKDKLYGADAETDILSTVVFNPGAIANQVFYSKAKKVVFTTGTWTYMNSIKRALGIDGRKLDFHSVPTDFPLARRPIYIVKDKNLIDFSGKTPDKNYLYKTGTGKARFVSSLLNLVNSIQSGLKETKSVNANVLIHINSFVLGRYIAEIGDFDYSKFIFHGQKGYDFYDGKNGPVYTYTKEDFLNHNASHPDGGFVYVSPSISEGVDFKHDLARAQIILKHPMPYFGDPYLQAMMGMYRLENVVTDYDIYKRKTLTTLVQQYGRVMRDSKDWGLTFIIDQKSVKEISSILSDPDERERANAEYFMRGIKLGVNSSGRMVPLRPKSFVIKL